MSAFNGFIRKTSFTSTAFLYVLIRIASYLVGILIFSHVITQYSEIGGDALAWYALAGFFIASLRSSAFIRYQSCSSISSTSQLSAVLIPTIPQLLVSTISALYLASSLYNRTNSTLLSLLLIPLYLLSTLNIDLVLAIKGHPRPISSDISCAANILAFLTLALSSYIDVKSPLLLYSCLSFPICASAIAAILLLCHVQIHSFTWPSPDSSVRRETVGFVFSIYDGLVLNIPIFFYGSYSSSSLILLLAISRVHSQSVFLLPLIDHTAIVRLESALSPLSVRNWYLRRLALLNLPISIIVSLILCFKGNLSLLAVAIPAFCLQSTFLYYYSSLRSFRSGFFANALPTFKIMLGSIVLFLILLSIAPLDSRLSFLFITLLQCLCFISTAKFLSPGSS